jgi:hypothetical protein
VTPRSVQVCRDARGTQWQLGPLPPARGRLTLVGWTHPADQQNSGVPAGVSGVLARALTSVARVTFPSSIPDVPATDTWSAFNGSLVRALTGQCAIERAKARLGGTGSRALLISTRRPDVTLRAFDDAGFPWWLQGQALLLSAPEAAPPDVNEPTLLALFENDWVEEAARLAALDVLGVVRPGVDGDLAGVLALSEAFDQSFLDALERETRRAGLTWSIVPEAAL